MASPAPISSSPDETPYPSLSFPIQTSGFHSLPDELLARILASLPLSHLPSARSVCCRWRSTISCSPDFLSFFRLHSPRPPLLLRFHERMYNQSWAYDLEGKRWFHFRFLFCPEIAPIAASSVGLVCLGRISEGECTMTVCNPLTKAWKSLPAIKAKPDHVLMGVDREASCYVIVALTLDRSMHVYESRNGSWTEKSADVPWRIFTRRLRDATISNGVLYCLTKDHMVVGYDVNEGVWRQLPSPVRGGRLQEQMSGSKSYLFDWQGQLSIAITKPSCGGIGGSRTSVCIAKYDTISESWKDKVRLQDSIICLARYGSTCMHCNGKSQLFLINSHGDGCCWDFVSNTLTSLPKNPHHTQTKTLVKERSLWFQLSSSDV